MMFAATLLEKAKSLLNSKDTMHGSVLINNSKSSCSNVTSTIFDNTDNINNINDNSDSSSTENISDTLNTGKFKS